MAQTYYTIWVKDRDGNWVRYGPSTFIKDKVQADQLCHQLQTNNRPFKVTDVLSESDADEIADHLFDMMESSHG